MCIFHLKLILIRNNRKDYKNCFRELRTLFCFILEYCVAVFFILLQEASLIVLSNYAFFRFILAPLLFFSILPFQKQNTKPRKRQRKKRIEHKTKNKKIA